MTKERVGLFGKIAITIAAIIIFCMACAEPAHAATGWTMGAYVSKVVPGEQYIIESVKFPGKVATPDTRAAYKDYIGLAKLDKANAATKGQIWHFTSLDYHEVQNVFGEYEYVSYERSGKFKISYDVASYGTGTLRLITYDAKNGFTAKKPEYNADGSIKDTQWFTAKKVRMENGHQVWKIPCVCKSTLAPGGWSEVYLRKAVYK